jgi:xylose isomerase
LASRVDQTAIPTLAPGESYDDLVADVDAHVDIEALAARGYAYAQLDQLAVEHLLGAR